MNQPATSADLKAQQTRHWNAVAEGWAVWAEWTERNFEPVTAWFRNAARWHPGAYILDVACGPGFPALAAAAVVRPGGGVVASDISEIMVAVGAARAQAAGLNNIEFRTMDAEALQFDDASFDAVMNAYGLMFCPDVTQALAEMRRVLKPGGVAACVTWDEMAKSSFFRVITQAAAPFLGTPSASSDAPGPFRLASAARLEALFRAAGFSDVAVESRSMTLECDSADEYCRIFTDVAWKTRIAKLSRDDVARFRAAVTEAVRPFMTEGRLLLDAASHCVSARHSD